MTLSNSAYRVPRQAFYNSACQNEPEFLQCSSEGTGSEAMHLHCLHLQDWHVALVLLDGCIP